MGYIIIILFVPYYIYYLNKNILSDIRFFLLFAAERLGRGVMRFCKFWILFKWVKFLIEIKGWFLNSTLWIERGQVEAWGFNEQKTDCTCYWSYIQQ